MRHLPSLVALSAVVASASLVTACGGRVGGQNGPSGPDCGDFVSCEPLPAPPSPSVPAPAPPSDPGTPSSSSVIGCVTTLDDTFESGAWSPTWWTIPPADGPTTDRMSVTAPAPPGDRHGRSLEVVGVGATNAYAQASSLQVHTTCFPEKARFGFDYRIDEGSLDASREDHAEIASVTGLDSKGVRCGLLMHVMQGRLRATTGPNLDLGPIAASTWARLEMTFDTSSVTFERDGRAMGSLPMGCALNADMVRFAVSGGRSYSPGTYRAYFDDVHFGALE